mgnify:FL=1
MNDNNSLAHTKWNCKYHIVFAPKYRRKLFYGKNRKEIGGILRQLSEWKGVKIVEAEHPHAGGNPTENECGGIHRISQREKQFDDFSTTRESEVQIWESIILVQRVLRGHRRKEYEKDRAIHSKSVERRSTYRSDDVKGIHGPACG